jgi:hypothetical protein
MTWSGNNLLEKSQHDLSRVEGSARGKKEMERK